MTRIVNMHEARSRLSSLVADVISGEEVVIAKAGKPVARLVPMNPVRRPRRLGALAGKFSVSLNFDDPLPETLLNEFGQ